MLRKLNRLHHSDLIDTQYFILVRSFNQPKLCRNASWNPNAITFADNITLGKIPHGLFVNKKNTVFVAHRDTGNILVWLNGSATLTTTIIANLSTPSCLFVTADDQIFLDNQLPGSNAQVDRWTLNQTRLSPPMVVGAYCGGLFVDINNNLYCSQSNQHQVLRRSLNTEVSSLAIVAGTGCIGAAPNKLLSPVGIFVTIDFSLYVADFGNNRVQIFRSGELNATTVAGAGSIGNISLNGPTGVVLDADGYLFIVDQNNHRIVGSGPDGFRCLVGCSGGGGSASNQLQIPQTLSFDTSGNMFVMDRGNSRIQKFLLSTNPCGEYKGEMKAQNEM